MAVFRRVGEQHLGHAADLGGGVGSGLAALARDQQLDRAADLGRGGERVQRRRLECRVVVLGKDQDAHGITLASLRSFSTSSCTEATLTPDLRLDGSSTLSVTRRGATSTP